MPADAVAEAFVRLHERGLIYKGSYLVNWSPNLQTAVSDLEVIPPIGQVAGPQVCLCRSGLAAVYIDAFTEACTSCFCFWPARVCAPTFPTCTSRVHMLLMIHPQVEYSEEPGSMFYFRYPVASGGPGDFLPVATTRPETILGDTAVAVHPEDPRFAAFIGKECLVPFTDRRGSGSHLLTPSFPLTIRQVNTSVTASEFL